MKKSVAMIQVERSCTRWPDGLLADLAGRPLLWRKLEQITRSAVNEVLVVASADPSDDQVAAVAQNFGVHCYRGEPDILKRFVNAARQTAADVIVRLPECCPLFDPQVIDRVIAELIDNLSSCDYASNTLERSYPRGLDVEAFTFGALTWMDRLSKLPDERAQVTSLARGRLRHMFLCRSVKDEHDNSDLRWTVNQPQDLDWIRRLYRDLDLVSQTSTYREIVSYLRRNPELLSAANHRPRSAA